LLGSQQAVVPCRHKALQVIINEPDVEESRKGVDWVHVLIGVIFLVHNEKHLSTGQGLFVHGKGLGLYHDLIGYLSFGDALDGRFELGLESLEGAVIVSGKLCQTGTFAFDLHDPLEGFIGLA